MLMLWHICIEPLPDTVISIAPSHGPCMLNGTTQSYLPPTRFIPARAEPHPEHLHPQSSTAFTHCLVVASLIHISPTPKGWYNLCQDQDQDQDCRPEVEPEPLASEASVLPLGPLLPLNTVVFHTLRLPTIHRDTGKRRYVRSTSTSKNERNYYGLMTI